jgi:16S rRNA (cytosine967-C5)-methyltransferase
MKFHSHLNTAVQLLTNYNGDQPFHLFIKSFFKEHKKYGSKDRKNIAHLCYCFFRIGHALQELPTDERIIAGVFLCSDAGNEVIDFFRPQWNNALEQTSTRSIVDKIGILRSHYPSLDIEKIFPFTSSLSEGIDETSFKRSHLIQPDLFLRIRPGNANAVQQELKRQNIPFELIPPSTIRLDNRSKIEEVVQLNKEAVVQDYSSQRVGAFLKSQISDLKPEIPKVWDCCAASGGKSIMAYDLLQPIDLTVSDIRESILINLRNRFQEAGINNYHAFVADLTRETRSIPTKNFDLVIADVPCSGSGTWSRTPEYLRYFNEKDVSRYSSIQKSIVTNIIPSLKPGAYLLYVTCSVFREENEEVVELIRSMGLTLLGMECITGYEQKADTMFAAVFAR